MTKVHALLVGIDDYRPPVTKLRGCRNDIALAEQLLRSRIAPDDLTLVTLLDSEATRDAIIRGFREHLARAGEIALFWFSGHGSTGPLPPEIAFAESAGECQTTVCWDSGHGGVPDLYDKEFGVLVREVVAGGAQLVSIKDSCHARSGLRDEYAVRFAPPRHTPPAPDRLLPGLTDDVGQVPGHIALSACQEHELAREKRFGTTVHGVFSHAVARTLTRIGSAATYREVLGGARCLVDAVLFRQTPALETAGPEDADRIFLSGSLRPRPARITMRRLRREWDVDIGELHGVGGPELGETRLARHDVEPLQEVRVVEVRADRSIVEPIGWTPDPETQYDMVLTRVPLPPVAVAIDAGGEVTAGLTAAIAPSPHLRVASDGPLLLRVRGSGELLVTSADDKPLAPPTTMDASGIARTVTDLEHIARWLQVRNLANRGSSLDGAVAIEVLPALPGERRPPPGRSPLRGTTLPLSYARTQGICSPPSVFVRLRNTTDKRLFCVLLDLTDRYRLHANLFRGEYVAPKWTAHAAGGGPITLSLPPGRAIEPGASGTDWLLLLVAEEPFNSDVFSLPRLGEAPRTVARGARIGLTGILDTLGLLAVSRTGDAAPPRALDWTTEIVEITTTVP